MATKNYKIEIDKGWFMSWFVTTQTSLKIAVTLKDEKKVYFSVPSDLQSDGFEYQDF